MVDWPGLEPANLFANRDLRPTTDLRALIRGVLAEHPGRSPEVLAKAVYPDTTAVAPMKGLIAT